MQKEIEERMKFLGRGWIVYVGGRKTKKGGHSLTPDQTWQISKQLTAC